MCGEKWIRDYPTQHQRCWNNHATTTIETAIAIIILVTVQQQICDIQHRYRLKMARFMQTCRNTIADGATLIQVIVANDGEKSKRVETGNEKKLRCTKHCFWEIDHPKTFDSIGKNRVDCVRCFAMHAFESDDAVNLYNWIIIIFSASTVMCYGFRVNAVLTSVCSIVYGSFAVLFSIVALSTCFFCTRNISMTKSLAG